MSSYEEIDGIEKERGWKPIDVDWIIKKSIEFNNNKIKE